FTFEAGPIVTLVLGPDYVPAARGLALLMWALPGAFLADTLFHLLAAQGRQAEGARAASTTAIFSVLLNLVLIPKLSFVGASIATAASEALCFTLLFLSFRARVPAIGVARVAWRPAVAALALGAVLAALEAVRPHHGPTSSAFAVLVVTACADSLVYALSLALVGGIERRDLSVLLDALPRPLARLAGRP